LLVIIIIKNNISSNKNLIRVFKIIQE